MDPKDQEKAAFRSDRGLYCYNVMPFGLKNAGFTYQRLVNRMFKEEIGKTMEVYIDDMVFKSEKTEQHMSHLENTFSILRKYHMKLNPLKCTFGVSSGKFLGYLVTQRGIEASTEQIKAVLQLESPQKPKDVQRLIGRVAALNRFISRPSNRCRLFYDSLRKSQKFEWTPEHEKAFGELKQYLSTPPILSKPEQGEPLYLYLSVTEAAVSAVLVREHEGMQKPVYYINKSLLPAETSGYDLKFEPRTAIKSQALADFVSDFSPTLQEQADSEILTLSEAKGEHVWELHVDGASNTKGAGVGLVLKSPQGKQIIQAVRCEFKATNNEAEYEALILGLQLALEMQINHINVYSDSQLIVNHVNNVYMARDPKMVAYLEVAKELKLRFASFHIQQIPMDQNVEADALATLGATFTPGAVGTIPFIHIMKPAIRQNAQQDASKAATTQWTYEAGILCTTSSQEETGDWRKPYISWLRDEGMDIVGPLPCASGNRTYMLAMTDYFSKWIEVEAFPQVLEKLMVGTCGGKLKMPPKRTVAQIQASEMTIDEIARIIEQQEALLEALNNVGKEAEKHVDATRLRIIIAHFNPPTYEGVGEPKLLEKWHREMESLMEMVKCPQDMIVEQVER
ncbi:uncharacterized protein LOC141651638 [Silene latifolia]|uniref:uncharacterized protein LOC141651638 n=1 Tax=Silene latifolia TaxID=37657 RepID=UPI003D76DFF2